MGKTLDEEIGTWQDIFVGRRQELAELERAWGRAKEGEPQFVVLLAETGMGKTRLVQRFYSWLSQNEDAPDPDGYWSDWLQRDRNSLSINPTLATVEDPPAIPWLWWGLRFANPRLRNRTEASQCGLVHALPLLSPHFAPLQREKEARGESVELGLNSMTALVGVLGMATLGPVAAPVVAALSVLSSLKDKVDLLRSAKKVLELRTKDDPDLAARALTEQQDAVDRIAEYFTALLTKGTDGKGAIPVVLVIDDAQWIDADTLAFLDRMWRSARTNRRPLMILCTHWEREWMEQQQEGDPAASVPAYVRANRDLFPDSWAPLLVGKVGGDDLGDILGAALPGLDESQRELILDRVDGNPGYLFDLVTILRTSKRKFFQGNDPDRALKRGAESRLRAVTSLDHYQLNLQRFADLDEEVKALLAWASFQGTRFVDALALEVARRMEVDGGFGAQHLARAENPYALIEAVSRMSHEFRQRTIHEIADQELREIEEDFHAFRDTLRDALTEWLETGRLDEFDPEERERMLQLLTVTVGDCAVDSDTRRTLGRALAALFEHYDANGQGRLSVDVASRLVSAMPPGGWPGETVSLRTQWAAATRLDAYLRLAESEVLWNSLVPRLEEAVALRGRPADRAWLAGVHLTRGMGLGRISGTHYGAFAYDDRGSLSTHQRERAVAFLDKAIEGFTGLETRLPWMARMLARAYEARGRALHDPHRPEASIADYRRAIEVLEAVPYAADDPECVGALTDLADYHTSCASASCRLAGGRERADDHFETAVTLLRKLQLEARGPQADRVRRHLTALHLQRGVTALERGDVEPALSDIDHGIAVADWSSGEPTDEWSPEDYLGCAGAQYSRSKALAASERLPESLASLESGVRVLEALRERSGDDWPLTWDSMLALLLDHRQVLLHEMGRSGEARTVRMVLLGIRETQEALAEAWTGRRRDLMVRGFVAEMSERVDEALDLYEQLRVDCGDHWPLGARTRLVGVYLESGYGLLFDENRTAEAMAKAQRAVELAEEGLSDPDFIASGLPRSVLRAHDLMSLVWREEGREQDELRHIDRALEIAQMLMERDDTDLRHLRSDLARVHERRGRLYRDQEDWGAVRRMYETAMRLREADAWEATADSTTDAAAIPTADDLEAGDHRPRETATPVPLYRRSVFLLLDYFEVGRAARLLDDLSAAVSSLSAAIELGERLEASAAFTLSSHGREILGQAFEGRGEVRLGLGARGEALADYDAALASWERLLQGSDSELSEEISGDIARVRARREECAAGGR